MKQANGAGPKSHGHSIYIRREKNKSKRIKMINKKELNRKISEKLKNLEANLPAADTNQLSTNKSQNTSI